MSFDLAVFSSVRPLEPAQAADIYKRLAAGESWDRLLERDPRVADFVREITRRWPQIDAVPRDEIESCPWSVEFEISPAHVISALIWSRVEDVAPVYIETALKHGLNAFDPQADTLYSPSLAPRHASSTNAAPRICARCGKPIAEGELSAEVPGQGEVFHIGCLLADWPVSEKN